MIDYELGGSFHVSDTSDLGNTMYIAAWVAITTRNMKYPIPHALPTHW